MARLAEAVPRACAAVIELVHGDPRDRPSRVGVPLRGEPTGPRWARRGAYRTVYGVDDAEVRIEHVAHRADVYRRADRPH